MRPLYVRIWAGRTTFCSAVTVPRFLLRRYFAMEIMPVFYLILVLMNLAAVALKMFLMVAQFMRTKKD